MADNAQQESSYKRLLTKIKNLTETYNNSVPFSAFTAALGVQLLVLKTNHKFKTQG